MESSNNFDFERAIVNSKWGFNNEEDYNFAKEGGFKTLKQVDKARKLNCFNAEEVNEVIKGKWSDGDELRDAINHGLDSNDKKIYDNIIMKYPHINWNIPSINWIKNNGDIISKQIKN